MTTSAQTGGQLTIPSTAGIGSNYPLVPPHSATGSLLSDALAAATTQVLHEWLGDDAANQYLRVAESA